MDAIMWYEPKAYTKRLFSLNEYRYCKQKSVSKSIFWRMDDSKPSNKQKRYLFIRRYDDGIKANL